MELCVVGCHLFPFLAAEEDASPFSAISATLGWDCFHWVTMLWIMLR
jgi:hypothetical protein